MEDHAVFNKRQPAKPSRTRNGFASVARELCRNKVLYLMAAPALILFFLFNYLPLSGIVLAFKDYSISEGIWGSPWVSPIFQNFEFFFKSSNFIRVTRNTLLLNFMFIIFNTVLSVLFSIMLNEMVSSKLRNFAQAGMLLPYFISWIVVSVFAFALLNFDYGSINMLLRQLGMEPVDFYNKPGLWPIIMTIVYVWKNVGYNSVLCTATLAGIAPDYYEAARIDGASRIKQIWYISLPHLLPTITVITLLSIGKIMNADFGMFYSIVQENSVLYPTMDVIDTYVTYREDLREKYDLPEKMETIEDIENYLEVVTANEDILPINNIIGSVMWDNAMSTKYSLDSQFGSSNFDITYVLTDETVTVVPLEQTDAFMEASQIRRRWYEKGWIPSNAMNDTETINGIDEGKYACTIRWTEDAYKPLTGPGEKGACMLYPDSVCAQNNSLSNVIGFNKNAANLERAMMFLEWMNASQENYDSVLYGIEGTTYVLEEDENGNQSVMYPEGENAQNGYLDWSGRWAFWRDQWRRPGFELSQELIEKNREDLDYENNIKSPMAGFTFDTDPVKEELANRQAVMDEYGKMLQYGLQEDVEAAVADYIDRMEVAGTDKIVEELQRQVDEFLAAKE